MSERTVSFRDKQLKIDGTDLKPGDKVEAINGAAVKGRDALRLAVAESEAGKPIKLDVVRGEQKLTLDLTPAEQPDTVPAKLTPAKDAPADFGNGDSTDDEPVMVKLAEFKNECRLYIPDTYEAKRPHGIVLLMHPEGGFQDDERAALVKQWLPHCRRDGLLLAVPAAAAKEGKWALTDLEFIGKAIDRIAEQYAVDPARIVAHGVEEGSMVALRAAAQFPERVRAAALVNSPSLGGAFEADPAEPFELYVAVSDDLPAKARLKAAGANLRKQFLPVIDRNLPAKAEYLDDEALAELARWIDTLDRI